MSTTRTITLTRNPDGRWTAYDATTETVTDGDTRDDALDKLDDAAGEAGGNAASTLLPPSERVGGRGLFTGKDRDGEAFAAAVERSREEFDAEYEEKQDDLFGQ